MDLVTKKFDIVLVKLDPAFGSEIKKTRPVLIISPDELNQNLNTVIIAPLTTTKKYYPTRINIKFKNKSGQIALDQIRTIDKNRIIKKLGSLNSELQYKVIDLLSKLFSK